MKLILFVLASTLAFNVLPLHAQDADLKALGDQRTAIATVTKAKFANDLLYQKLATEEKALSAQAAEARKAGNTQLADILTHATSSKHMEKRYYLRLMDPVFNAACQAYDDADPQYLGTKTSHPSPTSKTPPQEPALVR
jgi:hypothetical protein